MQKSCVMCHRSFDASRPSAKYCGERCKKRAQRQPGGASATVVALPTPPSQDDSPRAIGPIEAATLAELAEVDRAESALGLQAIFLAYRLDNATMETGAGVSSLARQHRDALAAALDGVERADDPLVRIRANALRLISG